MHSCPTWLARSTTTRRLSSGTKDGLASDERLTTSLSIGGGALHGRGNWKKQEEQKKQKKQEQEQEQKKKQKQEQKQKQMQKQKQKKGMVKPMTSRDRAVSRFLPTAASVSLMPSAQNCGLISCL